MEEDSKENDNAKNDNKISGDEHEKESRDGDNLQEPGKQSGYDKDFYKFLCAVFPRVVKSSGPCKGMFVYWIQKKDDIYSVIGVKNPPNEHARRKIVSLEDIPPELMWMKEMTDNGITIEGRERVEADYEYKGRKTNLIAEIIKSQKVKFREDNILIYFIRYSGQNMGTATWFRRNDLTNATLLLRKFEQEEHKKKGDFGKYELGYGGFTCRASFIANNITPNIHEKEHNNIATNTYQLPSISILPNNSYQLKGKGRKRIYNSVCKHRKRILINEKSRIYLEGGCLYAVLDTAYHVFPFKIMRSFITAKAQNWIGLKEILENNIKKYSPQSYIVVELQIEEAVGTLKENIGFCEGIDNGTHIILYRVRESPTGHSGLMKDGKIIYLKRYNHTARSKLSTSVFILERQTRFLTDLYKTVTKIVIFRIEMNQMEKMKNNEDEKERKNI